MATYGGALESSRERPSKSWVVFSGRAAADFAPMPSHRDKLRDVLLGGTSCHGL